MELIKRNKKTWLKNLFHKIFADNLFLLSSSVSYYSALAIAPFLLVLLGVAALIGSDVQMKVIKLATDFSPQIGHLVTIIFNNVNKGVNFGSVTGLIGFAVILWTASLVFLQMRYSLDVIYGHHESSGRTSLFEVIRERLFAMLVVVIAGAFLIISSSIPGLVDFFFEGHEKLMSYKIFAFLINIFTYVAMFWSIHFFVPSKRPLIREALKMGILSSVFFVFGNVLLATYFKNVALASIYGAAGTLLIFLVWTYYSSFTLFLSAEVFLYSSKTRKI